MGLVGVGLFSVDSLVVLDVLKGVVHQATPTSHVAIRSGAIHQLLLAERHQLSSLSEGLTFQRSCLKETNEESD